MYQPPFYSEKDIERIGVDKISYPFNDKDATYNSLYHQYELTSSYFEERGRNLLLEIEGTDPEKVRHFLTALRLKFYTWIYTHNRSSRSQLNYLIAVRSLREMHPFEYRQMFLEAMFIEGCYLLDNGDISNMAGVDFDTMQNMSADVMRNQDRDMHKDAIGLLKELGLNFYGKYMFVPQGNKW